MREIRTFELEHGEPAVVWEIPRPLVLTVTAGELWLTIEGDADDYWIAAGEPFSLPAQARAWISAGRDGARFAVASTRPHAPRGDAHRSRAWMPRWLQTA